MDFKVGDKVRIPYITDCNKHNNEVGTITYLHDYNYYPNRDSSVFEKRTQAQIVYEDGECECVGNIYRIGTGIISPVIKVNN